MLNKKSKNQSLKKLTSIKKMNKEACRLIFKRKKIKINSRIEKIDIILKLNKILIKKELSAFL